MTGCAEIPTYFQVQSSCDGAHRVSQSLVLNRTQLRIFAFIDFAPFLVNVPTVSIHQLLYVAQRL